MGNNKDISGWAQAVMMLMNLVFVVLDTTGIKRDSDILRILIVDLAGKELYHQLVKPVRYPGEPNTAYTGITQEQLDQAQTLREQWPAIQAALRGKYTLAYGHDFVQERLDDGAQAYGLEPIYLVGDCLLHVMCQYAHRPNGINLASSLNYVGFPRFIPDARGRAEGQITLLEAIANGQPRRQAVAPTAPVVVYDDLDDHPF